MDPYRISVQLWTVRDALTRDPVGTLRRLAEIGYLNVEPYNLLAAGATLLPILADLRLLSPTAHQDLVTTPASDLVRLADQFGVRTFVHPFVPATAWQTQQDAIDLAITLNAVADRVIGQGIGVAYHNHWWEFAKHDGQCLYDVFVAALDPQVQLQPDTYWVQVGGVSAPNLVRSLGPRVTSVHVKDGPITMVDADHVAVGQGLMPIKELLSAAPSNALLIVELDGYRQDDLFEPLQASFEYLMTPPI